jgi:hypothetical protein
LAAAELSLAAIPIATFYHFHTLMVSGHLAGFAISDPAEKETPATARSQPTIAKRPHLSPRWPS